MKHYHILMTYDDIDGAALAEQFGVSYQLVASLVAGAKRMTEDGELAKMLGGAGFTKGDLPPWFGAADKVDAEVATPTGEVGNIGTPTGAPTDGIGEVGGKSPPLGKEIPGVRTPASPSPTPSPTPTPTPTPITNTAGISAAQVHQLTSRNITYDEVNGVWVKVWLVRAVC